MPPTIRPAELIQVLRPEFGYLFRQELTPEFGDMWIGRRYGPHFGLLTRLTGAGFQSWNMEAVDHTNRPFFQAGAEDTTRQRWLTVGYADQYNIRLVPPDTDPVDEFHARWRLAVDPEVLSRLLLSTDIDVAELATALKLPGVGGAPLTEIALVWQAGTLYAEAADGTLTMLIGAGRAAGHAHADDETGGQVAHSVLSGLTAGDPHTQYLNTARHLTIGDAAPHHAAITLDANADTLLSLSTQALGLDTQAANLVFAGPTSGGAVVPTFRTLVAADIPAGYLLATGATTGATSQAQAFTNGITAAAKIHVISTTEQLRLEYDTSNYFTGTVSAVGRVTFNAAGTAPDFYFAKNVGIGTGADATIKAYIYTNPTLTASSTQNATNIELDVTANTVTIGHSQRAMDVTLYLYGNQTYTGASNAAMVFRSGYRGTVTCDGIMGCYGNVRNISTGILTAAYDFYADTAVNSGGGTLVEAYGYFCANKGLAGVTTSYGLKINSQSGSATNYAIYTGAGLHRFGDQLAIVGSADRQQLIVTGFSTQAVATPLAQITRADAAAGVSALLGLTALGSGAAGDGGSLVLAGKSSTTAAQNMGRLAWLWNVATHASRSADVIVYASDYAAEREIMRGRGSGTAAQFAVLGATPASRIAHVADPTGGATVDAEARTAINAVLATLETFGFHSAT